MKLAGGLFLIMAVVQFHSIANAADCTKISADFNPMECCKLPKFVDAEMDKFKATTKSLLKDKVENYLSECKATEAIFKEFKFAKDDDINDEEINKFAEKIVEDADWKPILAAAIKECKSKVNAKFADVQKKMEAAPFNVKKDQCNVKYGSFVSCVQLESFQKCPTSKWTDNKECAAGKQWAADCQNTVDSSMELHSKKA